MTKKASSVPLNKPGNPLVSAATVAHGPTLPAIERLKLFSDVQWEEFVLEWAHSLKTKYSSVERCGGAGDMGRDVIAETAEGDWDNYQCKHYKDALMPTDVWLELGKLVYYTYKDAYSYPRDYYFVAPRGVGTKLSNLLRNATKLKADLKKNWDGKCRDKISSTCPVPLDTSLEAHLDSLDFSIFGAIQPLQLIDEHFTTRWHVARFGGGLPPRPDVEPPPQELSADEVTYVQELLSAYSDHLGRPIGLTSELNDSSTREAAILEHFNDSRIEFYSAESLRSFSRDTLPQGEFEKLQTEMHDGIKDEVRAKHDDGYLRVVEVVKTARSLQISAHALASSLHVRDRGGICHQLANDKKIRWVP